MDSPTHKDDSDGQQIVRTYSYDQPPEQDSEDISQASNIARPTTMLQLPLATSMQSHARPDYTAFQDQYGYLPRGQVPHADAEITNTSYHSSSGYIPPVYGSHSSVAAYPTGSRVVQSAGAVASSWPDIQEQSQPYGPNTHITTASYYNPSTSAQPAASDAQQIYNAASQLQPPSSSHTYTMWPGHQVERGVMPNAENIRGHNDAQAVMSYQYGSHAQTSPSGQMARRSIATSYLVTGEGSGAGPSYGSPGSTLSAPSSPTSIQSHGSYATSLPSASTSSTSHLHANPDNLCCWGGLCATLLYDQSVGAIARHLREYHVQELSMPWMGRTRGCCQWSSGGMLCGMEMYLDNFAKHVATVHFKSTALTCPHCDKIFSRTDSLDRHIKESCRAAAR